MNRREFLTKSAIAIPLAVSSIQAKPKNNNRARINFGGRVLVNGKPMTKNTIIKANDTIKTKKGSFVKFAIGEDAFRVGSNASVSFKGSKRVSSVMIRKGKFLGVFKRGNNRKIKTNNATMGIRGTGVFVQAISPTKTKFCNCYGKTTAYHNDNKEGIREVEATHHKSVVMENGKVGSTGVWNAIYEYFIQPSHTDNQLREIEAMVARVPYFDRGGRKPFLEL